MAPNPVRGQFSGDRRWMRGRGGGEEVLRGGARAGSVQREGKKGGMATPTLKGPAAGREREEGGSGIGCHVDGKGQGYSATTAVGGGGLASGMPRARRHRVERAGAGEGRGADMWAP
jgi:hypothetical protein